MAKHPISLRHDQGTALSVLGAEVRFLCEAASTDQEFSIMEVKLPRDQGPGLHDHPWDEAYYILEGDVRFVVGDAAQVYTQGDFVYAPGGTLHSFKGASDLPARVLVLDAPAAAEGFFRDVDREVTANPADLAKIPAIAARHRMRFLPMAQQVAVSHA